MKTKIDVVWKLLRRNIATGQLSGYALANLVGLVIIIVAIQLYADVHTSADGDDPFMARDYLVLSKRVEGLGSLMGGVGAGFSAEELADLQSQPWAVRVGRFTASDFNVSASVDFAGHGMSTYLFFESIPDDFLDRVPAGWQFDAERPYVPIILSKDYLTLYNFGFAASRGMPQISEEMIGMVPLRVSLSGNGRQQWLPARVVGFSSRLNTIAVPQEFMDWANGRFSESDSVAAPSRVIVEADNPGAPAIEEYMDAHGLEVAGDKGSGSRLAYIMSMLTGIVAVIGLVITVLAVFILLLSIYLLLQKNREKLRNLLLLGYTARQLSSYYIRLVLAVNACVLVLGVTIMLVARACWSGVLADMGLGGASPVVAIAMALAIMAVISGINVMAIRSECTRCNRNE